MRPPGALHRQPVHLGRPGPALRAAQHDHRPAWRGRPGRPGAGPGRGLDRPDPGDRLIDGPGHLLVHNGWFVASHVHGLIPVAAQQSVKLRLGNPGQDRRVGDLPAVQVQDRQHGSVAGRVEEPAGVPGSGQRPGLRLAVADHAGDDEAGVVEGGAMGMRERVAEFAALVDRSWSLRRYVARHPAGKRELAEQLPHAGRVPRHTRVNLAVTALQPAVGQRGGPAVAWPDDVHHRLIVNQDRAVQVRPDEVQAGRRAPVAEQPRLDVPCLQRLGQQRVPGEVDLAGRQVVGGPPVGIQRGGVGLGQRQLPSRRHWFLTTTTEHAAWLTQCTLTEPVSIPVNAP